MFSVAKYTRKFVVAPKPIKRQFATFKIKETSEFEEKVIKASHKTPVIVDMKAEWCPPWYEKFCIVIVLMI